MSRLSLGGSAVHLARSPPARPRLEALAVTTRPLARAPAVGATIRTARTAPPAGGTIAVTSGPAPVHDGRSKGPGAATSLAVGADARLTHDADAKVTHLGEDGGFLGSRHVDPVEYLQERMAHARPHWIPATVLPRSIRGRDFVERMIPLGQIARPEDVAAEVLCLASPLASLVKGTSLLVDVG